MVTNRKPPDLEVVERTLLADLEERNPLERGMRTRHARARLRAVEEMWIDMRTSAEIATTISAAFNVDVRTVAADIRKVKEHHYLADELDRANRGVQMRAQWNDLRREARAKGDLRTAAVINDRLCKMDGHYQPERTEHININITVDATIDGVIEALSAKSLDAFMMVLAEYEQHNKSKIVDAVSVEVPAKQLTPATANDTDAGDAD